MLHNENQIIIDHTEVTDALRGRKVGERLILQTVEDAWRVKVELILLCPFAKAMTGRHLEWQDVVPRTKR